MELYIIAGPNGAGKTTFAREFLPNYADCELEIPGLSSTTIRTRLGSPSELMLLAGAKKASRAGSSGRTLAQAIQHFLLVPIIQESSHLLDVHSTPQISASQPSWVSTRIEVWSPLVDSACRHP
jgi:hypothetical protein